MSRSVYIFGETGRMGQQVAQLVEKSEHFHLLGGYSQQNQSLEVSESPDIVIDFSLPETLGDLSAFVKKHKPAVVSGTTGYTAQQKQQFQDLGQVAPVFWAANMSFGVYLLCKLTETLAKYEDFYDFRIEETHHIHKKDKPSGTALIVEEAARRSTNKLGEIESFREGEVFGLHTFIAESANEKLEIRHEAYNRGLFAQGALDISLWLTQQKPGFYGMEDFFKTIENRPKKG